MKTRVIGNAVIFTINCAVVCNHTDVRRYMVRILRSMFCPLAERESEPSRMVLSVLGCVNAACSVAVQTAALQAELHCGLGGAGLPRFGFLPAAGPKPRQPLQVPTSCGQFSPRLVCLPECIRWHDTLGCPGVTLPFNYAMPWTTRQTLYYK